MASSFYKGGAFFSANEQSQGYKSACLCLHRSMCFYDFDAQCEREMQTAFRVCSFADGVEVE